MVVLIKYVTYHAPMQLFSEGSRETRGEKNSGHILINWYRVTGVYKTM